MAACTSRCTALGSSTGPACMSAPVAGFAKCPQQPCAGGVEPHHRVRLPVLAIAVQLRAELERQAAEKGVKINLPPVPGSSSSSGGGNSSGSTASDHR